MSQTQFARTENSHIKTGKKEANGEDSTNVKDEIKVPFCGHKNIYSWLQIFFLGIIGR